MPSWFTRLPPAVQTALAVAALLATAGGVYALQEAVWRALSWAWRAVMG